MRLTFNNVFDKHVVTMVKEKINFGPSYWLGMMGEYDQVSKTNAICVQNIYILFLILSSDPTCKIQLKFYKI